MDFSYASLKSSFENILPPILQQIRGFLMQKSAFFQQEIVG